MKIYILHAKSGYEEADYHFSILASYNKDKLEKIAQEYNEVNEKVEKLWREKESLSDIGRWGTADPAFHEWRNREAFEEFKEICKIHPDPEYVNKFCNGVKYFVEELEFEE